MESIYILGVRDQIIYEHNWRGRSFRSVAEAFAARRSKRSSRDSDLLPVLDISSNLVFHVTRGLITILCVSSREVDAAYGLELIHSIFTVFEDYFGAGVATTELIVNNFDTVTELLCEMIDQGQVLTIEPNGLRDLVLPPSLLNKLMNVAGMGSKYEQQGQLSTIRWRQAKVKHTSNEIFVDILEELKAIVDKGGRFVTSTINGDVRCTSKLSGEPDVTAVLKPANLLSFASLHPCIDQEKFRTAAGTLSFIPPDGQFTLLSYTTELSTNSSSPLAFSIQFHEGKADAFELVLTTRQGCPDTISVEVPLPPSCRSVTCQASRGDCSPTRSGDLSLPVLLRWNLNGLALKSETARKSTLLCSNVVGGLKNLSYARVTTNLPNQAISGLKVESLKIHRTGDWKPYKGVKYATSADVIFRVR